MRASARLLTSLTLSVLLAPAAVWAAPRAKLPAAGAKAVPAAGENAGAENAPAENTAAAADRSVPAAAAATGETPAASTNVPGTPSESAHEPARERVDRGVDWEMLFEEGISAKEYAKQLDYFKVELGVEDSKGEIEYASHFSDAKPARRTGHKRDENRMAESWKKGTLAGLDQKLMRKAGVKAQGKKLFHFYPREIEREMFKLEQGYAGLNASQVVRTQFSIRPKTLVGGYELYVTEQQLKTAAPSTPSSRYSRSR
jgi:hypothetical protein